MDRLIYGKLLEWKRSPERKPLILMGVRQCGKTYILRKFGNENYSNVVELNFEKNKTLKTLFDEDLDPHRIIEDIRIRFHAKINEDTLIFFDEVQLSDSVLTAMKYFKEDAPEYHVACAGSLLGVMLSKAAPFPVGKVNFMTMYPMTFPEFLIASGELKLYERLKRMPFNEKVPEAFMTVLMRLYREYCFVGGMPEAVSSWMSERDTDKVRNIQSEITRSYELDFANHAPAAIIPKLNRIWSSIPEQLSKENKKFIFGHAKEGARAKDLEDALQWLIDAKLAIKVKMITRPSVPLSESSDPSSFKLYYCDIGLLGAMAGLPASSVMHGDKNYAEFKGGMTENYVLTELTALTDAVPYFWRSGNTAEIEFVHKINEITVPIEVKSRFTKRVQSMELYINRYDPEKALLISEHNVKNGKLTFIPLPLTWKIKDYLQKDTES